MIGIVVAKQGTEPGRGIFQYPENGPDVGHVGKAVILTVDAGVPHHGHAIQRSCRQGGRTMSGRMVTLTGKIYPICTSISTFVRLQPKLEP